MASLLSKISPIKPVKLYTTRDVQLQLPEQEEITDLMELSDSYIKISEYAHLPIRSLVINFTLLWPEKTKGIDILPLNYQDSKLITFNGSSEFIPLCIDDQDNKDIFPTFELSEANADEIPLEIFITSEIKVSDNLLRRLLPTQKVSGILYAERYWKTEKVPEYENIKEKKPINAQRNPVRPKDLHEVFGVKVPRPRFKPTFWDLLFVLLQPPLVFGKTDSLLLPHDLYNYQPEGVKFLVTNKHALLADDMGTGKTVMTIVALKLLMRSNEIKKALILCPPSVLYEWKNHIAEWFPEIIACFVRGTQEIRSLEWNTPAHIYVTTYDTLRSDMQNGLLPKEKWGLFDVVVVDEAHHIKNPNAVRSKVIKLLKPTYRWALTGTPIQNKIEDLASLFDFIYPNFITQYDLYEERIKLKVAPYFLRRRKQDVLKDLPSKIRQDIWLEMSEKQAIEYYRAEKEIISEIEGIGDNVTKQHIFAKMQRLKQICNFPSESNSSPKLDALKEQIETISQNGNKVIVFTQYIDQGIKKIKPSLNLYGTATIIGGQSDSERKSEIERFKHSDKITVLIASLRSGGEGLNLTEASYVIHFDHWWNPAVMWQAEDRVHRKGQKEQVNIYSYWMNDTIDERIHEILNRKGLLIENVIDGLSKEIIDELLTLDDLLEIIGVKKLIKEKSNYNSHKWQNLTLDQIHKQLFEMSANEFEELIKRLMHYLGYPNVKVTKKSHDGGIDVISTRIGINGVERIAAQCKRYKQTIGIPIAREFLGAIQNDKTIIKGYLVTTSEFSSECINYCLHHGIEMIPGLKIAEYVKRFGLEI